MTLDARRNLEIKVRVDQLAQVHRLAHALGALDLGERRDRDTYFRVSRGRLKLRESGGRPGGELIYYERPDATVSRYSDYHLACIDRPEALKALLGAALGVLVVVVKTRRLLRCGATRIHLDQVDGLGSFVELETVIAGRSEQAAAAEHEDVKQALGLSSASVVPVSYSDLMLARASHPD